MLPTILDIVAAYLIVRGLRHWKNWLPISLAAGALIALASMLALPGRFIPGPAAFAVLYHAVICALCAWGFAKFSRRKT
jgi:hypothetical protein